MDAQFTQLNNQTSQMNSKNASEALLTRIQGQKQAITENIEEKLWLRLRTSINRERQKRPFFDMYRKKVVQILVPLEKRSFFSY